MSAENLLLLLDECDELNIVIREFLRPTAAVALAGLLMAVYVGWQAGSFALAVAAVAVGAWIVLVMRWLVEPQTPLPVVATRAAPKR